MLLYLTWFFGPLGGRFIPGPELVEGAVKSLACTEEVLFALDYLGFCNLAFFFLIVYCFFMTNSLFSGVGDILLVLILTICPKSKC